MPQLDASLFPPQLVWLAITFVILYLAMAKIALPRISEVLEKRRDRIEGDLDRADTFKKEAEKTLADYEKSMAKAKQEALSIIRETSTRSAAESAQRQAEVLARLAQQAKAAERRISAAKKAALSGIGAVAAEVAGDAVSKLIGLRKVDEKKLAAALDAAMKEKG